MNAKSPHQWWSALEPTVFGLSSSLLIKLVKLGPLRGNRLIRYVSSFS